MVPGLRFQDSGHRAWSMEHGAWGVEHGAVEDLVPLPGGVRGGFYWFQVPGSRKKCLKEQNIN